MRSSSKRLVWVAPCAAIVCVALLAAGCGNNNTENTSNSTVTGVKAANPEVTVAPAGKPQVGGKLIYGLEAESDGFNPTSNRWALSGIEIAYTVYDPLFAYDDQGVPQPYLLANVKHSDDFTVWTSSLRPGISFHNGTPANAAAMQRMVQEFHDSPLTSPAFRPYKSSRIIDDLTLEITLSTPWANFPNVLTGQGGAFVAPEVFDNKTDGNRNPIGTGPFKFVEWVTDDHLSVVRNDNYWMKDADGQQLPYLSEIVFKPIPEAASRERALETHDVNMIHENLAQELKKLRDKAAAGELQYVPDFGEKEESFVMFNTQKAPLNDPLLRQALAYATDVDEYLSVMEQEEDQYADGPFEKSSKWYVDAGTPKFDLVKARELLAEYQKTHPGPVTFKIATTSNSENQLIVQKLQSQWKVIGVEALPDTLEQIALISQAVYGTYDALLFRQFGSPDPDGDYHFWAPINSPTPPDFGLNFSRLQSDQIQTDLDKARQSPDFAVRKAAYDDMQKQWATLVPYIWLDHVQWVIAADNSVRGIGNNLLPDAAGVATGKAMRFVTGAHRLTTTWIDPSSR